MTDQSFEASEANEEDQPTSTVYRSSSGRTPVAIAPFDLDVALEANRY
jgi:hypothetical protein